MGTKPTKKNKSSITTKTRVKISTRVEPAAGATAAKARSALTDIIAHMRPHYHSITDVEREAYRSRFSDPQCDKLGALTKSSNVVTLLCQWLPVISQTLTTRPGDVAGYGPQRFAYLLELGTDLLHTIHDQSVSEKNKNHKVTAKQVGRDLAVGTRTVLLRKLNSIAGEHGDDATALDEARGTIEDEAALADSLSALASLAKTWLDSEAHAPLVHDASLTESDVTHANEAADALTGTSSARFEGGRRLRQDAPEVNRVEGRVLAELRVVYQVFHGARSSNRLVPVLPLVTGTARVFDTHRTSKPTTAPAATTASPA